MCLTVYLIGAGLTRSLQLARRVPLMLDFVRVLTDYIAESNNIVLTTLVTMELGHVYETASNECLQLAEEIGKDVSSATNAQRTRLAELVASRPPESIERLFERVLTGLPLNIYSSGLPTYFRYAINQVFSEIGWNLRLDLLERFLKPRFQDEDCAHIFVSFNYDLALDQTVERAAESLWQPWEGYGFEFPFYTTTDPTSDPPTESAITLPCERLPKGSSRFRILKPHGSLNWLRRRPSNAGPIDPDAARDMVLPLDADGHIRYWRGANTFNCIAGTNQWPRDYEILIAPPSPDKPLIMQQALDDEFTAIRDADEIFVIGYSIPRTDGDQFNLIRKAIQSRKKAIESLTIVNYQASPEYFEDTRELFRPRSTREFNAGFADFAGPA